MIQQQQENIPLMIQVRPEQQIGYINGLTGEKKRLIVGVFYSHFCEMISLFFILLVGFPSLLIYAASVVIVIEMIIFCFLEKRKNIVFQFFLVVLNSCRFTIYCFLAVTMLIMYYSEYHASSLFFGVVFIVLLILLVIEIISFFTLFNSVANNSEDDHHQYQQQQQQQQPHNIYPVTQPVQIINQENTLGTQPQPSLIPQTIENQQPNHHHQQQELPQQIYYSVPQYIPPPPQILQQQQQQQPPNYPAGNYFYTK